MYMYIHSLCFYSYKHTYLHTRSHTPPLPTPALARGKTQRDSKTACDHPSIRDIEDATFLYMMLSTDSHGTQRLARWCLVCVSHVPSFSRASTALFRKGTSGGAEAQRAMMHLHTPNELHMLPEVT